MRFPVVLLTTLFLCTAAHLVGGDQERAAAHPFLRQGGTSKKGGIIISHKGENTEALGSTGRPSFAQLASSGAPSDSPNSSQRSQKGRGLLSGFRRYWSTLPLGTSPFPVLPSFLPSPPKSTKEPADSFVSMRESDREEDRNTTRDLRHKERKNEQRKDVKKEKEEEGDNENETEEADLGGDVEEDPETPLIGETEGQQEEEDGGELEANDYRPSPSPTTEASVQVTHRRQTETVRTTTLVEGEMETDGEAEAEDDSERGGHKEKRRGDGEKEAKHKDDVKKESEEDPKPHSPSPHKEGE
uniref:RxLR effector protein n=1 Tax=Chromera velia CCMP2878 TaxID=1169474 RepID=A0A0K6SB66_9ALVE|eukprot:Cvel_12676.t1-p1 / transcript=Cvel_12676.t1 / gene=Cvel_12676 / organism=Chromera_velia_CCMP2878 / gene_product=hypothetical protein / transcript_product=hypothetical protein / location=Cvel_scaffold838:37620-38990(-) / protein_length=299 / sequence_SO=supercontig / SO=protein_coding / is_pseudo=false